MKRTFALLLLAPLMLAGANAADLRDMRGTIEPTLPPMPRANWYVGVRGGYAQLDNTRYELTATANLNPEYRPSAGVSGFVGYDFGTLFGPVGARLEAEVGYYNSRFRQSVLTEPNRVITYNKETARGSASAVFGLVNGYLDFDFGIVKPYISAGIGYGSFSLRDNSRVFDTFFGPDGLIFLRADTAEGIAYQFGAGLSIPVMRNVDVEFGYRYLSMPALNIVAITGRTSEVDANVQQANLGVRIRF